MDIQYLGHSAFKLKSKKGVVVTDPYHPYVGFSMPGVSADIVTVSHDHQDHNQTSAVKGTARRDNPFIINHPGEYEVGEISVFGTPTFHDQSKGTERGENTVYTIILEGLKVCHLGDLGHELDQDLVNQIGDVDILLCPVGGAFTINPKQAIRIIQSLEPSIVIPMHYKTDRHDEKVFGDLSTLEDFLKEYGAEVKPETKLSISKDRLPEETEVVVLTN